MKVKLRLLVLFTLLVLVLLPAGTLWASCPPSSSQIFQGTVKFDSTPAPNNTEVTAWSGTTLITTVYTSGGSYGLVICPDDYGGDLIVFKVDGVYADDYVCPDTAGGAITLNLVVVVEPNIYVNPTSKNFGTVTVGASASQTFTVGNNGEATLHVDTITISGPDADQFAKSADSVSGQDFDPDESDTLQVTFSPTSAGSKTAQLNIPSDDPDTPELVVSLTGTGRAAPLPRGQCWGIVVDNGGDGFYTWNSRTGNYYGPFLSQIDGALDVVVTPDGDTAVISDWYYLWFVDISDPTHPSLLGSMSPSIYTEDIDITCDGRFAVVTDGGCGPVTVISVDIASRSQQDSVDLMDGAQAVAVAPDGTVIVSGYCSETLDTLTIDRMGNLSYRNHYTAGLNAPINIGIAPDGETVLVLNWGFFEESPGSGPTVTGPGITFPGSVAIYRITSPGTLAYQGTVSVPGHPQSVAFSCDGTKAYVVSNYVDSSPDVLSVLTIVGPGNVVMDIPSAAQLLSDEDDAAFYGVDVIAVLGNVAIVGNPGIFYACTAQQPAVVDLSTFAVSSLGEDSYCPVGVYSFDSPLMADFSAAPTSGRAPLNVHFTDESTGNIRSWWWDFDDGDTSNDRNPSHRYTAPGTYMVSLTVTGTPGCDCRCQIEDTATMEITVTEMELLPLVTEEGPNLAAAYLLITPMYPVPNQEVEISINIGNDGGTTGTRSIALYINDKLEQSQTVTVSPGSAKNIVFRVSKSEPGIYRVRLEGNEGQFTVQAPAESNHWSGPLGTPGIIVIVVVAIVLIVAIVFVFIRRE